MISILFEKLSDFPDIPVTMKRHSICNASVIGSKSPTGNPGSAVNIKLFIFMWRRGRNNISAAGLMKKNIENIPGITYCCSRFLISESPAESHLVSENTFFNPSSRSPSLANLRESQSRILSFLIWTSSLNPRRNERTIR